MGTNFYVTLPACENACDHCAQETEVHLGKSSAGWMFHFRGYRNPPAGSGIPVVNDYQSWRALAMMGQIADEYGRPWTLPELEHKIEQKKGRSHAREYPSSITFLSDGHSFTDSEFF